MVRDVSAVLSAFVVDLLAPTRFDLEMRIITALNAVNQETSPAPSLGQNIHIITIHAIFIFPQVGEYRLLALMGST